MTDPTNDPADSDLEREVRDLLAELGLHPDQTLTEEEQRRTDAAASDALHRIVATPPAARTTPTSTGARQRLPWRRVLTVGSVVAVSVVGATLVVVGSRSPVSPPHQEAVGATVPTPRMATFTLASATTPTLTGTAAGPWLIRLARAIARQPASGTGHFQLIQTDSWTLPGSATTHRTSTRFVPTITRRYVRPDGTVILVRGHGRALDGDGRLSLPLEGSRSTSTELPAPTGTAKDCPSSSSCVAADIVSRYQHQVVSPRLAAALWRSLAATQGIEYLGTTADRLGRPAAAFVAPGLTSGRQLVIFADPRTGEFLASETIVVTAAGSRLPLTPPAVVEFTVLVSATRMPRLLQPMNQATG
ncbi:MAG: hypothetical protein JWP74_542 [Marmoricola sp.]|nr:hypothetical protein [Marmoricola sp.]